MVERASAARRIVIAGGGTAGHVTVGLAIARAYRQAFAGVEMLFIGHVEEPAAERITSEGFTLVDTSAVPFARQGVRGRLVALGHVPAGVRHARRLLRAHDARLLIGAGAYPSVAPLLAARSLGLRIVVHEANVEPGLATRVGARLADGITLGWDAARGAFPGRRVVVSGNPTQDAPTCQPRTSFESPWNAPAVRRILVAGGSEGSAFLNERVPPLLARVQQLGVPLDVCHQSGHARGAVPRTAAAYDALGVSASVVPWIADIIGAYRSSDFAVSAAGALTLAELAIAGLPALVIPSPHVAGDHQTPNARAYADATGALWASPRAWHEETLAQRLAAVLGDPRLLTAHRHAAWAHARPDAARAIVAFCETVMAGRWGGPTAARDAG